MSRADEARQAALREKLAALWKESLPTIHGRLREIDAAVTAAQTGKLSTDQRISAAGEAHKLTGSVGMFGYMDASRLAHEIELLLESQTPDTAEFARLAARLREELPQH